MKARSAYRVCLRVYPRRYLAEHGDEIMATLEGDEAKQSTSRAIARECAALVWGGLRQRSFDTSSQKALLFCSLPIAFAGLGYLYVTVLWQPPLRGHSCLSGSTPSSCVYHPLLVSGYTWAVLGALVGLWVAFVMARALFAPTRAALTVRELIGVTPVVAVLVWWTFRDGLLQAGTRGEQAHILVVVLGAIVARLAVSLCLGRGTSAPSADPPRLLHG